MGLSSTGEATKNSVECTLVLSLSGIKSYGVHPPISKTHWLRVVPRDIKSLVIPRFLAHKVSQLTPHVRKSLPGEAKKQVLELGSWQHARNSSFWLQANLEVGQR